MSDFQIELSILCQYFWSIKPINEPILPKMDEISAQRFSREVPGNIKTTHKIDGQMDFELWNMTPKEIFRNKNHHQFFFLYFF